MPASPERILEYIAALSRLRSLTASRMAQFTTGGCSAFDRGKDITDELVTSWRAEIVQIDWLIAQMKAE